MPGIRLRYAGLTVEVDMPSEEDLQWLREFFCPWFEQAQAEPDVRIVYRVDPAAFEALLARGDSGLSAKAFMMDTRVIEQPCWRTPDDTLLLYEAERELFYHVGGTDIEIVAFRIDPRSRLRVMRVIRELAMDAAHAAGDRFLHASCVAVDGKAVTVTGPRSAGKTSLLAYLAGEGNCDYLTNDRLLVERRGGDVSLVGMPTIVSIRAGTLDMFPGLARDIDEHGYRTRLTLGESADVASGSAEPEDRDALKRSLSPAQFCTATGSRAVASAAPGIVLVPHQTGRAGGFELRELDASQARLALSQGFFGFIGPHHRSDAFRAPGARAPACTDEAFLDLLSASCRVYECALGTDVYGSAACADAVRSLL